MKIQRYLDYFFQNSITYNNTLMADTCYTQVGCHGNSISRLFLKCLVLRTFFMIGLLTPCSTSGSGNVWQLVARNWGPICFGISGISSGDTWASGSNRLLVEIVGRPQFTLELVDDVTSPGGETSLMVSINFVSSLLWLPRLETFWRSLLFSNSMRWVSSFWELSLFLYIFRTRKRSVICACMLTIVVGMFQQFSQVQNPYIFSVLTDTVIVKPTHAKGIAGHVLGSFPTYTATVFTLCGRLRLGWWLILALPTGELLTFGTNFIRNQPVQIQTAWIRQDGGYCDPWHWQYQEMAYQGTLAWHWWHTPGWQQSASVWGSGMLLLSAYGEGAP